MTFRPSRRAAALTVWAAICALVLAPAAMAQDDEQAAAPPVLLEVDAAESPGLVVRSVETPNSVEIVVNGVPAEVGRATPVVTQRNGVDTAIVIDNSVRAADQLDAFVEAARNYVATAPNGEEIAIYTTGATGRLRLGLNENRSRTLETLDALASSDGESKLWDAVKVAATDLSVSSSPGRSNLVILAGSADTSTVDVRVARGAVVSANISAFVVAWDDADTVPLGSLARLVESTPGGAYAASTDLSEIAGYGSSVAQMVRGTHFVPFAAENLADGTQLAATINGVSIEASYVSGTQSSGAALAPFVGRGSRGIEALQGSMGRTLGLVMGALAAALGAYAIASLTQKDPSALNLVLQPYADPYAGANPDDDEGGFSKNQLFQRAMELTEGFAERRGVLVRVEAMLERADLPLRAGEAMSAMGGIVLAAFVVGLLIGKTMIAGLIFAGLGVMVPPAIINFLAGRRQKAFMGQLPDTLQLLSSTLKAGYSFMQGVEAVSQEVEDPMAGELRRVVTEAQLGRPLEDALDASAERMDSPDFAWAVMAVKIQREVGGNLSELLLTVSETMTARERLRRDVSALTAEGKMSAIVLGALPVLLGLAMYMLNPEYISTLFNDGLGKILLGASITAALAGFAWMKKIITIDI